MASRKRNLDSFLLDNDDYQQARIKRERVCNNISRWGYLEAVGFVSAPQVIYDQIVSSLMSFNIPGGVTRYIADYLGAIIYGSRECCNKEFWEYVFKLGFASSLNPKYRSLWTAYLVSRESGGIVWKIDRTRYHQLLFSLWTGHADKKKDILPLMTSVKERHFLGQGERSLQAPIEILTKLCKELHLVCIPASVDPINLAITKHSFETRNFFEGALVGLRNYTPNAQPNLISVERVGFCPFKMYHCLYV